VRLRLCWVLVPGDGDDGTTTDVQIATNEDNGVESWGFCVEAALLLDLILCS
jgi:hypothetical protein